MILLPLSDIYAESYIRKDELTFSQAGKMSFVIGPFFGVLGAFVLERLYSWYRDSQNEKKLKESLRSELEKCLALLTGKGNLLPVMMWNSTVTSGDVKLLSYDERTRLSGVYFEIENHNYEAKRVRDSAVVAQTGSRGVIVDGMDQAKMYWVRLSKALYENEGDLKRRISELLRASWLKE